MALAEFGCASVYQDRVDGLIGIVFTIIAVTQWRKYERVQALSDGMSDRLGSDASRARLDCVKDPTTGGDENRSGRKRGLLYPVGGPTSGSAAEDEAEKAREDLAFRKDLVVTSHVENEASARCVSHSEREFGNHVWRLSAR